MGYLCVLKPSVAPHCLQIKVRTRWLHVQSFSCLASHRLSILPPTVPHWAPCARAICNTPQFLPFCGLVCSYWLQFPDSTFYWASSYSTFKAPVKNHLLLGSLLWSSLSSTTAYFSGCSWHFLHPSILCDVVSYLCAPAPSGWRPYSPILVSHHRTVYAVGPWGMLLEQIFP